MSEIKKLSSAEIEEIRANLKAYCLDVERKPRREPLLVVKQSDGVYVWDATGKRYLDFTAELINVNIGTQNRKVIEKIKAQMDELCYTAPGRQTVVKAKLAKRLAEIAPGDLTSSMFSNSGAEAVELALRLAQAYTQRRKIISLWDSYHGSTAATQSVGASFRAQEPWENLLEDCKHVPRPYCYRCSWKLEYPGCGIHCAHWVRDTIRREGPKTVAAFLATADCHLKGPPKEYWPMVQEFCHELGVVTIDDEVMSGFGRMGKMFGIENWNVAPDIMCMAKGLTSAYIPMGATMVNKKLTDYFEVHRMRHSYTTASHALGCAAALACIEAYYELNLIDNAARLNEYIRRELNAMAEIHKTIGEVRGKGLFIVVELVKNQETKDSFIAGLPEPISRDPEVNPGEFIRDKMEENGLLCFVSSSRDSCEFVIQPALCITKEQVDEGINIFENALTETEKKFGFPKK